MPCTIRRYNPNRGKGLPAGRQQNPMVDCIFCKNLPKVMENHLAYVLYDIKPLSQGHMLFIPKRHYHTIFESTVEEKEALFDLINQAKAFLDKEHQPDGYNVVINCGPEAGQVVMHAHIHLIPRYKGQNLNVREVIH